MDPTTTFTGFIRFSVIAGVSLMAARLTVGESAHPLARTNLSSSGRLETTLSSPNSYGTQDYTVTVVPGIAFLPEAEGQTYSTSGSLGRFGPIDTLQNFFAPIDLPAGAVVDFIGLNSTTSAPAAIGVALHHRLADGTVVTLGGIQSTVHDWATDYNVAPLNFALNASIGANILQVQQASVGELQFFGHVEVWWKRSVSHTLAVTFNDVPPNHPFYQFIEALAASGITAGCGDGTNFCPNNPVTRGQMAVFLAKALGLHWGHAQP